MIIVRLMGGLGNQMFQYAAGRRLANHHQTKLYADLSWFETVTEVDSKRSYELGCFSLKADFISPQRFALVLDDTENLKTQIYTYTKGLIKPRVRRYLEQGHGYNKVFLKLPNNTFLEGFWQSEKYFLDIRDLLLRDFSFKSGPMDKNRQALEDIRSSNAVSIHVRRGDYVNNKLTKAFHGVLGLGYYKKAVARLVRDIDKPRFFIFSDDPDWCRQNLKLGFPSTYISGNKAGFEDLRLMINCQHHIIANSSFSWWGAWLSENPGKIVIGPKDWFREKSLDTSDVLPKTWIKL